MNLLMDRLEKQVEKTKRNLILILSVDRKIKVVKESVILIVILNPRTKWSSHNKEILNLINLQILPWNLTRGSHLQAEKHKMKVSNNEKSKKQRRYKISKQIQNPLSVKP